MKFGLYWQIFIALIIGTMIGVAFPTAYKITDNTISEFQKLDYPPELINILQKEKKDFKETETEFLKRIKPSLGPEFFEQYKKEILRYSKYNAYLPYISWIGDLFLKLLAMITVPLVISSIISGLSSIRNALNLGRLFIKTFVYYFSTSTIAIFIGLFFANIFKPGQGFNITLVEKIDNPGVRQTFKESLMNIIPENIFEAFTSENLISIIFFSIVFGFFLTRVSDKSRIFMTNFFNSAFEVLLHITSFIIKLLPWAIMSMVAVFVADEYGDIQRLSNLYASLGKYFITVTVALLIHAVIALPFILYVFFRLNPWKHFKAMRSALVASFFTASAYSTLPITIHTVNKNCGVSNKISSFTIPLGTSISMEGTALYELVAIFSIAQAYGLELNLLETAVIIAGTLLASIGTSKVPMSGLVIMTTVLTAVGLPVEGIGLLVAVDRVLEMFRSSVNVWSDSCGAVLIAKSEGEDLKI